MINRYYPYMDHIEMWLNATNTAASRLSTAATGTPNHISAMRLGKTVASRHLKALLEYIEKHPDGVPETRPLKLVRSGRPKKPRFDYAGPASTKLPVPGATALGPALFEAIKAEAFSRNMPVAALLEELVRAGWQQYIQRKAA